MQTHRELKEFINNYRLISNIDHLIACDNHGWTDLRFTKLDTRLTPESKYFLALNLINEPHILYYDKLLDLRFQIEERMIKKQYVMGYDRKNNRVHLHYEGDGVFRIGNINGANTFRVQFEECTLKELAKRNDYKLFLSLLKPDERHRGLQTLLCELGMSLGFNVKIANNDTSIIINSNPVLLTSEMVLSFHDLNLKNIVEKKVEQDIDLIDVLWCDRKDNRIVVAFEVEFTYNYPKLLQRFSSLIHTVTYNPYLIVVGNDYFNFKSNYNRPIWYSIFPGDSLKYLCVDDLCDVLTLNKKFSSFITSENVFYILINNKLLPVVPFI